MEAARRKITIITKSFSNNVPVNEAAILEWMEGGSDREDMIVSMRMSRGWEEGVVISVDSDKGNFGHSGPDDQYMRTVSKLIVMKCMCPGPGPSPVERRGVPVETEFKSWPLSQRP